MDLDVSRPWAKMYMRECSDFLCVSSKVQGKREVGLKHGPAWLDGGPDASGQGLASRVIPLHLVKGPPAPAVPSQLPRMPNCTRGGHSAHHISSPFKADTAIYGHIASSHTYTAIYSYVEFHFDGFNQATIWRLSPGSLGPLMR
eukprot:1187735-Prorocentrum_minimum.AAC.1